VSFPDCGRAVVELTTGGVATAVVYGVMVFVASLPGAAVLAAAWVRGTTPGWSPG